VAGTPIVADTGNGDASATVSPALLEMFTEAARQVVVLADREARAIPFSHIGSEHLLIGMVDERDGLAAQALRRLGVDSNLVRARMHLHISPSDRAPEGELPLTPKALEVLEAARRQAERRELNFIGTEHLLLGLTVVASGLAVRILEELGVSVEQLAEALQGVLGIARGRLSWMVQQSNGAQVRGVLGAGWIDVLSLGPSIHLRRLLGRAPIRPAATGRGVLELDDLVTAFIELPQCAQLLSELGLKAEPIVSAAPGPSGGSWAQIDASEQVVAVLLAAAAHTVEDQRELVTLGDLLLALADNDSATLAARGLDPDAVREALRRRGRDDPA
jgi:CBS domain-containing protein